MPDTNSTDVVTMPTTYIQTEIRRSKRRRQQWDLAQQEHICTIGSGAYRRATVR